jgi:phosphatidate cytidylyltransferase
MAIDKERIVTGVLLLGGVYLIGVIDSFFLTWLFLGAVYMLAFYEAMKLFDVKNNSLYFYALLLWVIASIYPYGDDLFVIAGVVFASVVAYTQRLEWKNFLPFLYPTAGMLFTLSLYKEYGMIALLWLLVVVAAADIGAYVVGKSVGKTPFCITSPKKTLEGVLGGIVFATVGGAFVGVTIIDIEKALIVSLFVAIASVFGDLFESYLKRKAGVKDSGAILPGHGGVLDRIDGYLFGSVVMLVILRGIV